MLQNLEFHIIDTLKIKGYFNFRRIRSKSEEGTIKTIKKGKLVKENIQRFIEMATQLGVKSDLQYESIRKRLEIAYYDFVDDIDQIDNQVMEYLVDGSLFDVYMMYCLQQKGDFTTKLQKQNDVLVMKVMNPLNKLRWMDELHKKLGVDWWNVDFKRDCGPQHDDIEMTDEQVKELKNTFRIRKQEFPLTYIALYKQLLDCYHNVFPTVMEARKVKDKERKQHRTKMLSHEKLKVLQLMLKQKKDILQEIAEDFAFDDCDEIKEMEHEDLVVPPRASMETFEEDDEQQDDFFQERRGRNGDINLRDLMD